MPRHKHVRPIKAARLDIAPVAVTSTVAEPDVKHEPTAPALAIPADWNLGALLNVRNGGEAYIVTLYPEEADWRHPERQLHFPNTARCQDFVSAWYARTFHDPRAG